MKINFLCPTKDNIVHSIIDIMKELGEDIGFSKEAINACEKIGDISELNIAYTVFEQAFEELDVINKISNLEVDYSFKPYKRLIIEKGKL